LLSEGAVKENFVAVVHICVIKVIIFLPYLTDRKRPAFLLGDFMEE
jgi:hypothetical protein